jgi:hypothetical protein
LLTDSFAAADQTIDAKTHTRCLAVVCLQTMRRGHFDDENERCSVLKR